MAETQPHPLDGHLEDEARNCATLTEASLVSIAVSLKKIADAWGKASGSTMVFHCEHGLDFMECKQCAPF